MSDYKKVKVEAGPSGWGGPLEISPNAEKKYIAVSYTHLRAHETLR